MCFFLISLLNKSAILFKYHIRLKLKQFKKLKFSIRKTIETLTGILKSPPPLSNPVYFWEENWLVLSTLWNGKAYLKK